MYQCSGSGFIVAFIGVVPKTSAQTVATAAAQPCTVTVPLLPQELPAAPLTPSHPSVVDEQRISAEQHTATDKDNGTRLQDTSSDDGSVSPHAHSPTTKYVQLCFNHICNVYVVLGGILGRMI